MSRLTSLLLPPLLTLLLASPCLAESPTQRDWMENLIDGLGWSFGLPDEPVDADYLTILGGTRFLHLEAEDAIQPEDPVSIKTFTSFGDYTGSGWVSGTTRPSKTKLKFLLPAQGRYQIAASLRLKGHRFEIGGQMFEGDGTQNFTRVVLGEVDLPAGEQDVVVTLPPNGAIDYFELKAPALLPIEPLLGWSPDQALTMEDLAVTALRLLNLESSLPQVGNPYLIQAESASQRGSAEITTILHLGSPSGEAWLRAGAEETEVDITFAPPTAGVFRLDLRATGTRPIFAELDGRYSARLDFPPYLENRKWFTLYLDEKPHTLKVTLPPRAGIDALHLFPLASGGEDFLNLSGLRSLGEAPTFSTIDQLLTLLVPLAPQR